MRLGGWTASVEASRLEVSGAGAADDWWRVVAEAAWRHLDEHGEPAGVDGIEPPRP